MKHKRQSHPIRLKASLLRTIAMAIAFLMTAHFGAPSRAFATTPSSALSRKPFKIVIDAGHGGSDHGTVYENGLLQIAEKDVTLLIARGVARELQARGFEVTLTRTDDRELPLGARTQLANRLSADLFLSIHMNSTQSPNAPRGSSAEGIETYILNNASDASSKRLAHLENTVISHDGIETPEQADVALILRDLRLDANLSESKRLACAIQSSLTAAPLEISAPNAPLDHLDHRPQLAVDLRRSKRAVRHPVQLGQVRRRDRGVKQALFHVLLGADMPSVLLEAGFLSSPRDRALVLSPQGRHAMSTAIAGAIEQFRLAKGTPRAALALSRCKVN